MKSLLEKIAVMQAAADGKVIQTDFRLTGEWADNPQPTWAWGTCDYRVKPREPKVIYVNEYRSEIHGVESYYHGRETEANAIRCVGGNVTRKAVKYREVIEDEQG